MDGKQNGLACETIAVHNFSEKILEQVIHFHVMKLSGGFFLWVGSAPELSNLAVSMCSKYVSKYKITSPYAETGGSLDCSNSAPASGGNEFY